MSSAPSDAPENAAAGERLNINGQRLAAAFAQVESLANVLKDLEASARSIGLRETSQACETGDAEATRDALSRLQIATNMNFAELRRSLSEMRANLRVLEGCDWRVTAALAAEVKNGHGL